MDITVKEIDAPQLDCSSEEIVILPHNYQADEGYEYHSTTISFYKYSRDKLDIKYLTEPELLVEQRSGDWFGPLLFISSSALLQNPELVSIMCGVIANYVTDFFKSSDKPNIRLKVIHKETKTSKLTEISYEGGLEGLDKLEESINRVVSKSKKDE
tara:strand:- start:1311 stop:1778 length:468 start_codon:yes stop_codon:yes gene_type:complete